MEIVINTIYGNFISKLQENKMFNIKYSKNDISYLSLLIDMLPQEDEEHVNKKVSHKRKSKNFKYFLYEDPKLSDQTTIKKNKNSDKYDIKQEK